MKEPGSERVTFYVESDRGDDKLGTEGISGNIITDFDAHSKSLEFMTGVPQERVQEAVEKLLGDDKVVTLEHMDGKTELLTKKDLPKGQMVFGAEGEVKDPPTPPPKEAPKVTAAPVTSPKPACQTTGPKEKWESKFENIKSATATYKAKGG